MERKILLPARSILIPVLILALFSIIRWGMPSHVFWSTDEGNRFIQVQSLDISHATTFAIPYPAAAIDPQFKYFPDGGNHFLHIHGRIYSYYVVYFSAAAYPFYKALGIAGLYVVPLGFFFLLLLLTEQLFRATETPAIDGTASFLLAFATPFFFYALTFWEHTAAVALSTGAFLLILQPRDRGGWGAGFVSGILLAISTSLREEGYIFFAALLLASIFIYKSPRRCAAMTAGFVLFLLPAWMLQSQMYDHALGTHAFGYRSPVLELLSGTDMSKKWTAFLSNFFVYLFEFERDHTKRLLYVLPHLAALLLGFFTPEHRLRGKVQIGIVGLICCTNGLLLWDLFTDPQPMSYTLFTQGFFPAVPFVVLGFLYARPLLTKEPAEIRMMFLFVLLYVAGTCVNLNQKTFGIIWGPRHFLPLFPMLLALSFRALQHWKARTGQTALAIGIILFAISIAIQGFGVALLARKLYASADFAKILAQQPEEVIVTDAFWLPEQAASLFFQKRLLMVHSESELRDLLSVFKSKGIHSFLFIRSRAYHFIPDEGIKPVIQMRTKTQLFLPPGLNLMDTAILSCKAQ